MEKESFAEEMKRFLPKVNSVDVRTIPPLSLAYIGDSVMDLMVRTYFATSTHETVSHLNNRAIKIVNAAGQATFLAALDEELTEEEKNVVRRGRNAKSQTSPKNQSINDYRLATGFEALLGYLFITGKTERICELFSKAEHLFADKTE